MLLLAVGMRPLVSETYRSALVMGDFGGLTPAATAFFDLAIWLAALAAVVGTALGRRCWRWTGAEIGWLVLVVAAVVSTVVASNKRLAINASCDWLTAIVAMMVLANLMRDRLRVVLILAVLTASGLASAAKCVMQVTLEFDEAQAEYKQRITEHEKLKAESGYEQDAGNEKPEDERVLFERRLEAGEAAGFLAHPNHQGSWLGLAGFAAVALAGLAGRFRGSQVVCVVLAAGLFAVIFLTGSKGALAATAGGVGLWFGLRLTGERLRRHWRATLAGAWVLALVGGATIVLLGWARGGLPSDSLRFRWNYWQVTREVIADRPWTGVGALNFDQAYLAHKPVEYPEEIKDPHNFVLSVAAQWGIVGVAGLGLALIGGSVAVARRWGRMPRADRDSAVTSQCHKDSAGRWIVVVVVGFMLLRLWLLREWWLADAEGVAATFFDLGAYGLIWAMCFAGMVWLVVSCDAGANGRYRLACLCGVAAFLLHNTIGFSLFAPGTLFPFMAMAAVLIGGEGRVTGSSEGGVRRVPLIAVAVAGLTVLAGVAVVPVAVSSYHLRGARHHRSQAINQGRATGAAIQAYEAAAAADRWDPIPEVELASWRRQIGRPADLAAALVALDEAERRDPKAAVVYSLRWRVLVQRYKLAKSEKDLEAAVEAAQRVVQLYPESPDRHKELADLLTGLDPDKNVLLPPARVSRPDWLYRAGKHYRTALSLDASRPQGELRRWSEERRLRVEQKLKALEGRVPPQLTGQSHLNHLVDG